MLEEAGSIQYPVQVRRWLEGNTGYASLDAEANTSILYLVYAQPSRMHTVPLKPPVLSDIKPALHHSELEAIEVQCTCAKVVCTYRALDLPCLATGKPTLH